MKSYFFNFSLNSNVYFHLVMNHHSTRSSESFTEDILNGLSRLIVRRLTRPIPIVLQKVDKIKFTKSNFKVSSYKPSFRAPTLRSFFGKCFSGLSRAFLSLIFDLLLLLMMLLLLTSYLSEECYPVLLPTRIQQFSKNHSSALNMSTWKQGLKQ